MEKEEEKKIMMAKFGTMVGMNGIVEQDTNNQAKTM